MSRLDASIVAPLYPMDKIIATQADTVDYVNAITASSSSVSTNLTEDTFAVGIYSYDGGTTWQDFVPLAGIIATPPQSILLTLQMGTDGQLTIPSNQFALIGSGGTFPLMRKFAFIARPDGTDPPEEALEFTKGLSYTSKDTYMKIADDESQAVTGATTITIDHNLGYEPMVQVWAKSDGQMIRPFSTISAFDPASSDESIEITSTSVIISTGVFITYPATFYCRIYYEN